MQIGIIAGNRLLPIVLARNIKNNNKDCHVTAICFKGETSRKIRQFVDRSFWTQAGNLGALKRAVKSSGLTEWVMAGQINPLRIFKENSWDSELRSLVKESRDFRPHNIFKEIIGCLESEGVRFLDSTLYLGDSLSSEGKMVDLEPSRQVKQDIDFGVSMISKFVELDVGQTAVVKSRSVVAVEALEGTDNTIIRGYRAAGPGSTVLKFSKSNQDLRFDVPVVGLSTLRLLKRVKAASLVLESKRVLILEKDKFLLYAERWGIPVIGKSREGGG